MIVTVMSDASFCPRTGASGWGAWAKSDRGNSSAGGNFSVRVSDAEEAEAKALAVAVFLSFQWGVSKKRDHLVIQTDCKGVIHAFQNRRASSRGVSEAVAYTKQLIKKEGCTYDIRHVKAHVPTRGKRNYINNVCDSIAKIYMKKEREGLK